MSAVERTVLEGERVCLRRAVEADVPRFLEILAEPSVAAWWPTPPEGELAADVRGELSDGSTIFAVEDGAEVVGLIQYAEELEPDYRHAAIDIFLCTGAQGRGLGTDAVQTLARHLVDDLGHHRLTIDPAAHNERAIRCYGRVGFRPVGVMRRYERGRDGSWHDGLLMDLLADELTP